jgi:hypothetical protein
VVGSSAEAVGCAAELVGGVVGLGCVGEPNSLAGIVRSKTRKDATTRTKPTMISQTPRRRFLLDLAIARGCHEGLLEKTEVESVEEGMFSDIDRTRDWNRPA